MEAEAGSRIGWVLIRVLPPLKIRWITELLHRRAMDRLVRTDRGHGSLVDCSSFVVMEEEGIREALALDKDFSREGFGLLPDPGKIRPKG